MPPPRACLLTKAAPSSIRCPFEDPGGTMEHNREEVWSFSGGCCPCTQMGGEAPRVGHWFPQPRGGVVTAVLSTSPFSALRLPLALRGAWCPPPHCLLGWGLLGPQWASSSSGSSSESGPEHILPCNVFAQSALAGLWRRIDHTVPEISRNWGGEADNCPQVVR